MTLPRCLLAFACAASAATASASVIVVDLNGAGDFLDLTSAVAAASDGDIVLVRPGDYSVFAGFLSEQVTITGKSLTIAADPPGSTARFGRLVVKSIPASGGVIVRGLDFTLPSFPGTTVPLYQTGIVLENDLGPVVIEDCELLGAEGVAAFNNTTPGFPGLSITNCASVVATRCTITGGRGANQTIVGAVTLPAMDGGPGVLVAPLQPSGVALYDCTIAGGVPGAPQTSLSGGAGIKVTGPNAKILLSGTSATGGAGPNGGPGLHTFAIATGTSVYRIASAISAGAGANGMAMLLFAPINLVDWTGPARSIELSTPVAQFAPVQVDLIGKQGDVVFFFWQVRGNALHAPGTQGFLTVALPAFGPFALATIASPSGHDTFSVPAPALVDPMLEGFTFVIDPVFATGGPAVFGAPSAFVLLQ